ncbi:MAG: hypothetical protein M9962_06540 [Oligoflexia bacterium]|nr:hypothetical protein [Oligoflexia bacterium]
MQLKQTSLLVFIFLSLVFIPELVFAERRAVVVTDSSSSGKLVRVSIGEDSGLSYGDPVLLSESDVKVASGRVVQVSRNSAVIAVLEQYTNAPPSTDANYDLLFGEPFDEADYLPNYVVDRDEETPNPSNERFFTAEGEELNPELDDDSYTPEVTLRPRFPDPRTYNTHNITIGAALFRNRALQGINDTSLTSDLNRYTTYQGWAFRYAYTFRTHYWFRSKSPALISIEAMVGIYNFDHTFPGNRTAQVRVTPVGFNARYLIEVSKLFRIYPYIGYLNNLVGAVNGNRLGLEPITGGRLLGGGGAQLVMSDTIDSRLEAGTDGVLLGLVVKF